MRIILRIIGRVDDPRIAGKSSTASDGDGSVTGVESTRRVDFIGQEFHEHRVPEAGVHYRFGRVANFDQQRCLLVLAPVNLQFVEIAIYLFLDLYLWKETITLVRFMSRENRCISVDTRDTNFVKSQFDAVPVIDLDQPLAFDVDRIRRRISGWCERTEGSGQMATATIDRPLEPKPVVSDKRVGDELQEHLMLRRMNFGGKHVWIAQFRELFRRCSIYTLGYIQIIVFAAVILAQSLHVEMGERQIDLVTYGGVDHPAAVQIVLVLVREIWRFYYSVVIVYRDILAHCKINVFQIWNSSI